MASRPKTLKIRQGGAKVSSKKAKIRQASSGSKSAPAFTQLEILGKNSEIFLGVEMLILSIGIEKNNFGRL